MAVSSINYSSVIIAARDLLMQLGIEKPENLQEILNTLEIDYKEVELREGFDGALVSAGGTYGMMINKNITYEARRRFTIAHELGHYWIPSHFSEYRICSKLDIGVFDSKKDSIEYEADIFAAEFLMPEKLFKKDVGRVTTKLKSIADLSEKYKTSLTATAIRFVDYTLEPCALILLQDKSIRWAKKSRSFRYELRTRLTDCYAFDIAENGEDSVTGELYSHLWLANPSRGLEFVYEDAINFKWLNQQLVLLTLNNNEDESDDYCEE